MPLLSTRVITGVGLRACILQIAVADNVVVSCVHTAHIIAVVRCQCTAPSLAVLTAANIMWQAVQFASRNSDRPLNCGIAPAHWIFKSLSVSCAKIESQFARACAAVGVDPFSKAEYARFIQERQPKAPDPEEDSAQSDAKCTN